MNTNSKISLLKDKRAARTKATFAAVMVAYEEVTTKLGRKNAAQIIASAGRRGSVRQSRDQKLAA